MVITEELKRHFLSYAEMVPGGCWIWKGGRDKDGYGIFHLGRRFGKNRMIRANRFAFKAFKGELPDELKACHSCDNPPCVNPDHLFSGTNRENLLDASAKGRTIGEKAARCRRLTNEQVQEMRRLYAEGIYYQKELAIKFGITQAYASKILRFENWKLSHDGMVVDRKNLDPEIIKSDKFGRRTAIRLNRLAAGLRSDRDGIVRTNNSWPRRECDSLGRWKGKL